MLLADIEEKESIGVTEIPEKRTFGEYIGKIRMSDDFNESLPDTFWLGESDEISPQDVLNFVEPDGSS